jgi:hypothetical protein
MLWNASSNGESSNYMHGASLSIRGRTSAAQRQRLTSDERGARTPRRRRVLRVLGDWLSIFLVFVFLCFTRTAVAFAHLA